MGTPLPVTSRNRKQIFVSRKFVSIRGHPPNAAIYRTQRTRTRGSLSLPIVYLKFGIARPADGRDRFASDRRNHALRNGRTRAPGGSFRRGQPGLEVTGHIVILVDDGLTTGSTMRAAVEALRHHNPERIVVGAPLGASDTCSEFHEIAHEVICAASSEEFLSVGSWYGDVSQITDEAVEDLLDRSKQAQTGRVQQSQATATCT
jgi:hypothetical protein